MGLQPGKAGTVSLPGGKAGGDRASLLIDARPLWGEGGTERDPETSVLVYEGASFQRRLPLPIAAPGRKRHVI